MSSSEDMSSSESDCSPASSCSSNTDEPKLTEENYRFSFHQLTFIVQELERLCIPETCCKDEDFEEDMCAKKERLKTLQ